MNSQVARKVDVMEVTDKRALKKFIRVPWAIYKDDPILIPPLLIERKEALSSKHPYFKHANWKAWVAFQGDKPVGRISAQIDDLHQQRYNNKTGFFGLIEAPEDDAVFSALFETAENWLRGQGMEQIVGPFNLGINQEVGILTEGFDTPPCVMTSHSPRYYGASIERCGYQKAQELLAYELDIHTYVTPSTKQELIERTAGRIKVRQLNRKTMEADFEVMRDVFNDAWQDNWNFVPFTREEFRAIGKEMLMLLPKDFIQIAEIDGQAAAFVTLLPNLNEAIADLDGRLLPFGWAKLLWRLKIRHPHTARVPLMGVKQEFQHSRLGPTLAFLVIDAVRKALHARGVTNVEMGWILEDNEGMRNIIETIGGEAYKRYRLYEKSL